MECCKEFCNILFGYPIKVYSDHKNLVHAATQSQSQQVMCWRLILKEFGPNIVHIKGDDNIVADVISRLPTTTTDQRDHSTEALDLSGKIPAENEVLVLEDDKAFPLNLSLVRRTQQIELNKNKSKIKQYLNDKKSGYVIQTLNNVKLVTVEGRIYVLASLQKRTMEWYHYFMNHPGGERLFQTLNKVFYWKGMKTQCLDFCKKCPVCWKFKSPKRKYGQLPPRTVGEQVPWDTVHVDLIGPYSLTAKQFQPQGHIKEVELQLTCMTMLDPVTGWFEIVEVPNYIVKDMNVAGAFVLTHC